MDRRGVISGAIAGAMAWAFASKPSHAEAPVIGVDLASKPDQTALFVQGLDDNSMYDGKTMKILMENLLEHQRNGVRIVFG